MWRKARSSFYVIVLIGWDCWSHKHDVGPLRWHLGTPVILNVSHWEYPRLENQTIRSGITDWILFGMISTFVCNLYATTAHSKIDRRSQHSWEKGWTGQDRWCSNVKHCVKVSRGHLVFASFFVEIEIDFHQLRGKTDAMVGWFLYIGGQCVWLLDLCLHINV